MTDNRKFKKLVREYMDKYNLTYTEALKRVKNIHQIVPLSSYFNKNTIETIVDASTRNGLLLISGLTSTGKTTLLNSITNELAKSDRLIINIHNSNHQPKEVLKKPGFQVDVYPNKLADTPNDLIRRSIRMSPDVLAFDEVNSTIPDLIDVVVDTGHFMIVAMHSRNTEDSLFRLEKHFLKNRQNSDILTIALETKRSESNKRSVEIVKM